MKYRVIRGGSFINLDHRQRSTFCNRTVPGSSYPCRYIGFRVVVRRKP